MNNPFDPAELHDLIEARRDGELSPQQAERLEALLRANPAARREFVREQMLDAALHLESSGANRMPARQPAQSSRSLSKSVWRWSAAALVIFSVGLAAGIAWKNSSQRVADNALPATTPATVAQGDDDPSDDGIAVITRSVGAVWDGEHQPLPNAILSAGNLRLKSGVVQIAFYSGASMILDGATDLELVSAKQVICRSGRIRAHVPEQAIGFAITAPQFKVVDLGTEFGMEVSGAGSKVQVFDGAVEVHTPAAADSNAKVEKLLQGKGVSWTGNGQKVDSTGESLGLPSFADLRQRSAERDHQRFTAWQEWNRKLRDDPRIAVRYDFESDRSVLRDSARGRADGTLIGCDWTSGRWPEKSALEFKRPGDRVRVNIPGQFDSLTLSAWIRVDACPDRLQGLLLTDGYEIGKPHWQLSRAGELRLGIRIPSTTMRVAPSGYGSPALFTPRQIGVWTFIATVYDRKNGIVRHYANGEEVSSEKLKYDQPLTIGSAEIGNWGVPLDAKLQPIRNFVGRMDEFTLWQVALSSEEIREINKLGNP